MKRFYTHALLIVIFGSWLNLAAAQNIEFPDENLANKVRTALGLPADAAIPKAELATLTVLDASAPEDAAPAEQISNLTGLEHATQLIEVYLDFNAIVDLRPLAALTQLEVLSLWENQINDITPLTALTQLEVLFLWENQINDITPLTGLTQLVVLDLSSNEISNVTPLTGLINLESLYLEGNPIADKTPLHTLLRQNPYVEIDIIGLWIPDPNLRAALYEALDLPIGTDIQKAQLETLTALNASASWDAPPSAKISDLTGLEHATRLTQLALTNNQLRDIRPLTELTQLTILSIGNNQISDIRPLAGLTQLIWLDLNYNHQIIDIHPLTELTQLTNLHLTANQIIDIRPLAGLTQLTTLGLGINQLSDIRPLSGLTQLMNLYLPDNQISDIKALAKLTNLTTLNLKNNRISDVTALAGLVNLAELSLAGNPILYKAPLRTLLKKNPDLQLDIDTKDDPAAAWMPDPNLRIAVRETLGLAPSELLTQEALQELTELDAYGRQISDLTGLEHATQLTDLSLYDNAISDLTPLSGLTRLTFLDLSYNQISDITPLTGLTQLTELFLAGNQIRSITPLAGLTALILLDLAENRISDVPPLTELVNLEFLILSGNPLTSIAPLLTLLEKFPYIELGDIDGSGDPTIAWMPDLKLHAAVRSVLSLMPSETLTQEALQGLTQLAVREAQINNLTGLEHATQLLTLNLNSNQITDITPLEGLTQLTELYLSYNEISDITPLSGLTHLTTLRLDFNQINDITPLAGLTQLTTLILDGNEIQDITPLTQLTHLNNLYLGWETGGNAIRDITPLAELIHLNNLYLQNNQIRDVTALAGLVNLDRLFLMGNPITDTAPLQSLLEKKPDLQLDIDLTALAERLTDSVFPDTTVRLIYFVPRDRPPQPDIDAKLDTLIKDVQMFFADGMEHHGFGRKTFAYETDNFGKAVVHHVKGQFTDAHYHHQTIGNVQAEIDKRFDTSKNIYLIVIDISTEVINIEACGMAYWTHRPISPSDSDSHNTGKQTVQGITASSVDLIGGLAIVPASGYCFIGDIGFPWVAAHELGHAFGLEHDFRNNTYLMSYGGNPNTLARCSAEWLNDSRYFNPDQTSANNKDTTIEMLPPLISPPYAIRLQFKVSDADGLKRAQLITASTYENPGGVKLIGCETLTGQSQTVEFVTTELTTESKFVTMRIMDGHGYFASLDFPIDMTALYTSPQVVSIPDVNLAAVLREALDLSDEANITQLDMLKLRGLFAGDREIKNLKGLEYARNLKDLHLDHNQIQDIAVLAKLPNLASLYLSTNQIQDFSPVKALTNLVTLDISDNLVDNLTPITTLTQLQRLSLGTNQISDIKPLAGLTQLIQLRLWDNQINDITALAGLTELAWLYLDSNKINDITPLKSLTNLIDLSLGTNQISDIKPLAGLTQLTHLALWENQISDITALEGLTTLTRLELDFNKITDLTPLKSLTNLIELSVNFNQINDIKPLAGLTQLTRLTLWENQISDVTSLKGLVKLEYLFLEGNPVTDKAPLYALLNQNPKVQIDIIPVSAVNINAYVPSEASERPPMYWVDTKFGTLHHLTDDTVETLVPGIKDATDLAVDVAGGKVYWVQKTGSRTGKIQRANLDGTNVERIKELTSVPYGIALDAIGGKIYLTNSWGKLQRLNVDGTNFQPNLITRLDSPRDIVVDRAGGKVYWTETAGRIRRANLNGSNIQTLATGLGELGGIAIAEGKIYWTEKTDENSGKIQYAPLNGNPIVEELTTLTSVTLGIAVDTVERRLYWTNSLQKIQCSTLDGEDIQDIVLGLGAPADIVLGIQPVETTIAAAPVTLAAFPDKTDLLPNYPNPFNPETWIPYQLSEPADVTLTIYAVNGTVVRTLALGHQPAGIYKDKARAAYWDGRNAVGEPVASGVYFYTLTAGEFTATRKLLIRK